MNGDPASDNSHLETLLQPHLAILKTLASERQGDCFALIIILRHLEKLHREIREELFEPSLPNVRNDLYNFLKDIDESGGWPYIERMKLKTLLLYLFPEETTPKKDCGEGLKAD